MRYLAALLVVVAVSGVASAAISFEVQYNPVPNTGSGEPCEALAGYIYNDVVVTTDSDWMRAILIVTPDDPAKIHQHEFGTMTEPIPGLFGPYPTLEYDTYVSNGDLYDGISVATLFAASVGRDVLEFTTDTDPSHDELAVEYYTNDTDDTGTLTLARVTLHNTTSGTWYFFASASPAGGPTVIGEGTIVNGEMVPEPATMVLLGLGGIGVLLRRRRK